jgi:hypothetical protein
MNKKYQFLLFIFSSIVLLTLMTHFGPGNSLDARLTYSYGEALSFFDELSSEKKMNYAKTEALDFLFIINYTMLLYLFMSWVFPDMRWILFFVLLPGAFDFVETLTLFLAMVTESRNWIFAELGAITFLKWMSGVAAVATTLATLSRRKAHIHN